MQQFKHKQQSPNPLCQAAQRTVRPEDLTYVRRVRLKLATLPTKPEVVPIKYTGKLVFLISIYSQANILKTSTFNT